ncbi:MAG: zinc-binding alcohol dehydrogenase family protein [Bosea sp.]|uniref:zinc-binding dehydrogenase n=1 Tax=Bosea sp. (in: a-proteobacteria) TaxID=1871050 RepID=UPI0010F9DBB1|nr:zinc-binding alcohol dehydrogenase family protein [Bosea sp. (in: a-proteobacteria)]
MKAAYYSTNGEPDVLQYGEVEEPRCGPEDITIKVTAISLEGGDLLNRRYTQPEGRIHIPGYQAAGVVAKVGDLVETIRAGDRVVGFNWSGSHADLFVVPQHLAYPVPAELDLVTAAAVPVAFGTAREALFEFGRLAVGETVLIHGAGGNVGIALVQFAKRAGATVIGTASSDEKLDRLRQLGLDHGINSRGDDIRKTVSELTGGAGVDLVVDLVGAPGFPEVFASLRRRGRMVLVGAASGQIPSLDYHGIRKAGLTVTGLLFGKEMHTPRVHSMISEIFADVVAGRLVVPIEKKFALGDAAAAHRYAEQSRPFGKVILVP